jgi:daunorubicin resistance ABC transporter ATP-binding subunit
MPSPPPDTAIEAHALHVRFGDVTALDGLDLTVAPGHIFGLLGPNGAGKSTLVRVLATLQTPTSGHATVLGHDVVADSLAVRRRIGFAGQFATVDEELTGRENLELIARLSRLRRTAARGRAGELLERFGLTEAADRRTGTYSGGMRRRLDLAAGVIGRPPVVLLDEPSTGLDPRSRQELWSLVSQLSDDGTTVLLTTQYLEEADRLAERIAVLDGGRIVAEGAPAELKASVGAVVLSVRVGGDSTRRAAMLLTDLSSGDPPLVNAADGEIRVPVASTQASGEALRRLDREHVPVTSMELEQPSLDDVFLHLTGRPARPETRAEVVAR